MNRVDTKFITDVSQISRLLEACGRQYFLQKIDERYNMPYFTRYYDTPDTDMFYQHQRGKKRRQKIRTRVYEGAHELEFLEIKSKNNKGRTSKKRVIMEPGTRLVVDNTHEKEFSVVEGYKTFVSEYSDYRLENLLPQIENHFFRLTLVNIDLTERITIDTGIEFHNIQNHTYINLGKLGIIEWKRDGVNNKSGLGNILRELRIHESGFSKYCMGMAMTDLNLRTNRLKSRIRRVNKLLSDH